MTIRWPVLAMGAVLAVLSMSGAEVRVTGKIVDDNQVPVAGARVWIEKRATQSDDSGAFGLVLERAGEHRISAQREGFFLLRERPLTLLEGDNPVTLVLNHQREVFDSVEVSYSPPAVNPEETAATQQLAATQLLGIPFPSTNNLRNAMAALPGLVQDHRGQLHIRGGTSDQTFWTLDGFNITDPLTNRFESRVSLDGIQTVEVDSSRYSAETGKGSAGAVQIRTGMGDDRWRPAATNFVPGVEHHKGLVLANWTPRATVAGPIRRGRVWISNAFEARYDLNVVEELPKGEDRSASWNGSNLLRLQVNLTPGNILTASWLANRWSAPRNGLTSLDPLETTVDRRSRQDFISVKDQLYLGRGLLLEIGWASTRGAAREIPQGREDYIFTPDGRRGNFFLNARRHSGRDQWLANAVLPAFQAGGGHQLKAGVDLDRLTYYQDTDRHAYEFYRWTGTRTRRVDFGGSRELRRKNFEAAGYMVDRWKPWKGLLVEWGARLDWDQIVRAPALSPRVSFSLAVPGLENTKVAGGFGLFHDATNLRVLSRHLDQYALARYYGPDGRSVVRGPALTLFLVDDRNLRSPVYRNWSLGLERMLPLGWHGRFEYLRRRGRDGFAFFNTYRQEAPLAPEELAAYGARQVDGMNSLGNLRRDVYDSFEVTARKTFRRQLEVLASYTRSRAFSNAALDPNIDDPLLLGDTEGRMSWDTPNRFVSWGIVTLTEKNAVAYLAEWRDGFPFTVNDDEGRLVGLIGGWRLPAYFSLNLHLERKFQLWRWRWAWRGGFNNLTNRRNATVVNNNASSPRFLESTGGQHRAFVARIRWLGRR